MQDFHQSTRHGKLLHTGPVNSRTEDKKRATKIYLHVYAIAHPWWPLSCVVQSQHCIRRDLDVFSSYHFQIVRHNSSNHPAAWLVNNDYPAGREREARVFMLITSIHIHIKVQPCGPFRIGARTGHWVSCATKNQVLIYDLYMWTLCVSVCGFVRLKK